MQKKSDHILQLVAKIPLCDGLEDRYVRQVADLGKEKTYAKGETIFFEGDQSTGFYVVAEGRVKIYKASAEGKEQILHFILPGEPFGEVAVFSGSNFPATAEAVAKTRLLFFPKDGFVQLIAGNPMLAVNMLAVLSMRLRQFATQVEQLSLKEVPARLATHLRLLAAEQQQEKEVVLHISKGQLAGLLGTIPETLSRVFAKMSDQGLIRVNGANIRILDPEALKDLAEYGKPMM